MRRSAKALQIGVVLAMSMLALAGCGRRERLDRTAAEEVVVFQMDNQTTQNPVMTAPSDLSPTTEPNTTANNAAPTATPYTAAKTVSGKQTPDADMKKLMDDLEDTLNELDASITAADQDTLTDSALIALGK